MAGLAIRVSPVHRETNIIVDELAVAGEAQLTRARYRRLERTGWRKEWVPAFSTEKVLFVVSTFTESRIVERDKSFVDDGCLAVETAGSKGLFESYTDVRSVVIAVQCHETDLVIVQMTVRPPIMFIATHVLQEFVAAGASETARVPPLTHSTHNATNDGSIAPSTRKAIGTHRIRGGRRGRETTFRSRATGGRELRRR